MDIHLPNSIVRFGRDGTNAIASILKNDRVRTFAINQDRLYELIGDKWIRKDAYEEPTDLIVDRVGTLIDTTRLDPSVIDQGLKQGVYRIHTITLRSLVMEKLCGIINMANSGLSDEVFFNAIMEDCIEDRPLDWIPSGVCYFNGETFSVFANEDLYRRYRRHEQVIDDTSINMEDEPDWDPIEGELPEIERKEYQFPYASSDYDGLDIRQEFRESLF